MTAAIKTSEKSCDTIKQNSVPSILKWAVDSDKWAGVVTTTRITHATPGASYAHVAHRNHENDAEMPQQLKEGGCKDIARQLLEDSPGNSLRVILGGGRKSFLPASQTDPKSNEPGLRKDARNLIEEWTSKRKSQLNDESKYRYVNNTGQLMDSETRKVDYLMGLFNYNHVAYDAERDESDQGEPSLEQMTIAAINVLRKGENGFVLLVEGGRIDHAHHENWANLALRETIAFDKAIEAALNMVDPQETLVIVTADHAHTLTINGYPQRGNPIFGVSDWNETSNVPFTTLMYGNGPGNTSPRRIPNETGKKLQVQSWKYIN